MFQVLVPCFGLMFIIICPPCECNSNSTILHLLGLFPMSGDTWPGGRAMALATELALQDVNANPDILPGYEIVVVPRDTACDGGRATEVMYRELYNMTTIKMMIIGAGCSAATESTAQASHYWNLIQISLSLSSTLSNRARFPRSFRLLPPESMFNIAKFALLQEFNWKKVATLHESYPLFSVSMADFHKTAKLEGIDIIAAESFVDNPSAVVENIKNLGARIVVVGVYSNTARKVFCEAYHQKMYGAKYVWIVTGWLESNWWREQDASIDCSPAQMDEVVDTNHFGVYIDYFPSDDTRRPSISGVTTSGFLERYRAIVGTDSPERMAGYNEISVMYDTVWTQALALHKAQEKLAALDPPRALEDFKYDTVTVQIFFDIISNLTFEGISGPVKFNHVGDRQGLLQILQMQGGGKVPVGDLDSTATSKREIIWNKRNPIIWQGGAPPIDFIIQREDRQTIQLPIFITGALFAIIGIALGLCFLAFNIYFRNLRVIKMSSPNINNLMLIGGILAYLSIIFLGVDTGIASTETFVVMCKAKTWCLSIGFSMAFGSMFSKTWRVHKIFTSKTAMRMILKDYRLVSFVASVVLVDVLILILWEIFDPMSAKEQFGSKVTDTENDDIVYTPIRIMCESANQIYWIGAFYVLNGLLLVFGAFLAWETRKVSIPALNDSKYIGVCVYNVLILSFIGAPVSFVLEERNAHFALVATLIWLATTLTLCVVFVPKIKMRNDVMPAQNTAVSTITTQNHHSNLSGESLRELQVLRKELLRIKQNCLCSVTKEMTGRSLDQGVSVIDGTEVIDISQ